MKTKYIKSFLLFLLLGCCISVSAQNIQGVVTDSLTNDPIPYLSVFYEGKGVGSITDNDGHYKVETRKGWNKLTFSAVGYVTKVVNIIPGGHQEPECEDEAGRYHAGRSGGEAQTREVLP